MFHPWPYYNLCKVLVIHFCSLDSVVEIWFITKLMVEYFDWGSWVYLSLSLNTLSEVSRVNLFVQSYDQRAKNCLDLRWFDWIHWFPIAFTFVGLGMSSLYYLILTNAQWLLEDKQNSKFGVVWCVAFISYFAYSFS